MSHLNILEYVVSFAFSHVEGAEAKGRPQSLFLESMTDPTTRIIPWWNALRIVFETYQMPRKPEDFGNTIYKHWSDILSTPLAFSCAFALHSWLSYFLNNDKTDVGERENYRELCVWLQYPATKRVLRSFFKMEPTWITMSLNSEALRTYA
jgi:hypothetical protein